MQTTALSAIASAKADIDLTAEERLQQVAAILATGLLRIKIRLEAGGRRL